MLKTTKRLTYISLFSSAGVGCYGFKKAGFECVATNEIIERRLNIQKINNKCFLESGYICGDLTQKKTKDLIYEEIEKWEDKGNDKVDVVIATPPCQGMSVANHKKTDDEIVRNSLIVESIKMVKEIMPRFFIFENVPAFMKTGCTAPDGTIKKIGTVIYEELGSSYVISDRVLNLKSYGSNSSRTRTIVIGVHKDLEEFIAPMELYPLYREEKTLREVIGDLPSLDWSEVSEGDFYHQFRTYQKRMRCWIHDLKEGEGAFDNEDPLKRPHRIIDNEYVPNKQKNGDKYTRQYWDKVAPCIHTRNDQLASQNTIHPVDDRVFSIRELMKIMTIPDDFKWHDNTMEELNSLPKKEKVKKLRREEMNIRQSIGEAVPTEVFYQIACRIRDFMEQEHLDSHAINKTIKEYDLVNNGFLKEFIKENPLNLGYATLARIAELTNNKRENNSAYFTNKFIINEMCNKLPSTELEVVNILEPSVGVGNFLPILIRRYEDKKQVNIDVCDIDSETLEIVKLLIEKIEIPKNINLNYIHDDFLLHKFDKKYFLTIGNPPFTKLRVKEAKKYLENNINQDTTNMFEFFLEKAMKISEYVAIITPKSLLNTPEFSITREYISNYKVDYILDFGENGFKGVLVETICIFIDMKGKPNITEVFSRTHNKVMEQKQDYIFDKELPYWVIYRDDFFDEIYKKMEFGIFDVFRDRQITKSNTMLEKKENSIRVVKSRNISDNGSEIIDIDGYDTYIDKEIAESLRVYKYMNDEDVYLTPNMTYNPRVMKKRKGFIVNGSVAILIPKYGDSKDNIEQSLELTDKQIEYFSTDEYRKFYKIARNYQTRSLNIDNTSVFWFGRLKDK